MKTTKVRRVRSRSTVSSLRLDRITPENAAQFLEEQLFAKTRREYIEWKSRLAGKRRFAREFGEIKSVLWVLARTRMIEGPSPWEITHVPRPYNFAQDVATNVQHVSLDDIKTGLATGCYWRLQQQRKNVQALSRFARYFKKQPVAPEQPERSRELIKAIGALALAYDEIFKADESGKPARRPRETALEDLNDKFLKMRTAAGELLDLAGLRTYRILLDTYFGED